MHWFLWQMKSQITDKWCFHLYLLVCMQRTSPLNLTGHLSWLMLISLKRDRGSIVINTWLMLNWKYLLASKFKKLEIQVFQFQSKTSFFNTICSYQLHLIPKATQKLQGILYVLKQHTIQRNDCSTWAGIPYFKSMLLIFFHLANDSSTLGKNTNENNICYEYLIKK